MVPLGVQFAASGLVGNKIGQHDPEGAKQYAAVSILAALLLVGFLDSALWICRASLAGFFTQDPQIISIIVNAMEMLCIFILFDAIHGVNSGTIRALGK